MEAVKVCVVCDKEFRRPKSYAWSVWSRVKCCSRKCSNKWKSRYFRQDVEARRKISVSMKGYFSKNPKERVLYSGVCIVCQKEFSYRDRRGQKFCSRKCWFVAFRSRSNPLCNPEVRKLGLAKVIEANKKRTGQNHPLYGKPRPKETRQKLSVSNREAYDRIPGLREKFSKIQKGLWQDPVYAEDQRQKIIVGLMESPSSYEVKIMSLCEKYRLQYRYIGDGQPISKEEKLLCFRNPDFVHTEGKKRLIETFTEWCHHQNYAESRGRLFAKYGWKTLFLGDEDCYRSDWEPHCLQKIRDFESECDVSNAADSNSNSQ